MLFKRMAVQRERIPPHHWRRAVVPRGYRRSRGGKTHPRANQQVGEIIECENVTVTGDNHELSFVAHERTGGKIGIDQCSEQFRKRRARRVKIASHACAHSLDPVERSNNLPTGIGQASLRDGNGRGKYQVRVLNRRALGSPGVAARRSRRKARSQERERFAKIGDHLMGRLARFSFAQSDENPQTNPGCRACLDVAHFIAQNHAASGIESEVRRRLQEHSRLGFAPWMVAMVFADAMQRVMRAVIDAADCRAFRFKTIAHPSRQIRVGVFVEIAAADTRLIDNDDDRPPQLFGPEASQVENPGNELELIQPIQVAAIHVDDTVPVEEKRALIHVEFTQNPCYTGH
jgi:hypothetical protein